MALPIAKNTVTTQNLPDQAAIEKILQFCDSPESTLYAKQALQAIFTSSDINVMNSLDQLLKVVELKTPKDAPEWRGVEPPLVFNTYIINQASDAATALKAAVNEKEQLTIRFDFAMSDLAVLLQGFLTQNGDALDATKTDQLNALFSEWLVSQNMICEDGVIYQIDKNGDFLKAENGEFIRANVDHYRQLFSGLASNADGEQLKGFAQFVSEKTDGRIILDLHDVTSEVFPVQVGAKDTSRIAPVESDANRQDASSQGRTS